MDSGDGHISDKYLAHEEVKAFEDGRPLEFFKNLSKNMKKLRSEISMLNQISMTDEHEDACIPHISGTTSHLNRYCDILPFKHSAVTLEQEDGCSTDTYINANHIPGPFDEPNLFVACQGPKSNTVKDFWRMVRQQNIGLIVMLCRLEEGGRSKCAKYWETGDITYDDINLEVKIESSKEITTNLTERQFELIDTKDNSTISTVTQIQYTGWPDHGVPEAKKLDDFDKVVEYTMEEYNKNKDLENPMKTLVHCSAGIGRTGTLLTIIHILAHIDNYRNQEQTVDNISVFSMVRRLREHRFHLVQTDVQYYFIYQYLAKYLKKVGLI